MKIENLSTTEAAALQGAAAALNIPKEWLFGLIQTESRWKPNAANPKGSAKGLIQWVDSTAQALGYADSADLIAKNPTREAQLLGPVVAYLKQWTPISSPEDLAAVNFYPAYRNNLDAPLPASVQAVNPGIVTVRDYFSKFMQRHIPGEVVAGGGALALVLAGAAFLWWRSRAS